MKLATASVAARQITAQRDQALYAHGAQRGKLLAHGGLGCAYAREVASRFNALRQNFANSIERAILR